MIVSLSYAGTVYSGATGRLAPVTAQSLVARVEAAIERRLPSGTASITNVGRDLAMSARTLHRRLAEEGTSFCSVLATVRLTLARRYLAQGRSLAVVAYELGYSEQSNFHHAFRRWTGKTPAEYRRNTRA